MASIYKDILFNGGKYWFTVGVDGLVAKFGLTKLGHNRA